MILGVNTSHNASFCLVDGSGNVQWLLEEERFSRLKDAPFATLDALDYAVAQGMVNPASVSSLVYSFEMDEERVGRCNDAILRNVAASFGAEVAGRIMVKEPWRNPATFWDGFGSRASFSQTRDKLEGLFPRASVESLPHHLCHAASVYYPCGADRAAVLVIDGAGRIETTTIWRGEAGTLTELARVEIPHSIGLLYWMISGCFLGLQEGQVMGLASFGRPLFKECFLEHIIDVDPSGLFRLKAPVTTWFEWGSEHAVRTLGEILGIRPRGLTEPLAQIHADLAASLQAVTELVVTRLASHALQLANSDVLCLAGGVAQNCSANGEVAKLDALKVLHLQPAAHDAGSALGAALELWTRRFRERSPWRMTHAMHGAPVRVDSAVLAKAVSALGLSVERDPQRARTTAELIADGRTVAWATGRAEVGPRALGHRSIFANPSLPLMAPIVNRIKQRHVWRPFAPACLEEQVSDFFEVSQVSPYMMIRHNARQVARDHLPAIVHLDGSSRVQAVGPGDSEMRSLLVHLIDCIGYPVVLNTSFNRRSEPIVQRPLEALVACVAGGIDDLFLEDLHIRCNGRRPVAPPPQARFVGLLVERLGDRALHVARSRQLPTSQTLATLDQFGVTYSVLGPSEPFVSDKNNVTLIFDPCEEVERLTRLGCSAEATVLVHEPSGYFFETDVNDALSRIAAFSGFLNQCVEKRTTVCFIGSDRDDALRRNLEKSLGRQVEPVTMQTATKRSRLGASDDTFLFVEAGQLETQFMSVIASAQLRYGFDWLALTDGNAHGSIAEDI